MSDWTTGLNYLNAEGWYVTAGEYRDVLVHYYLKENVKRKRKISFEAWSEMRTRNAKRFLKGKDLVEVGVNI